MNNTATPLALTSLGFRLDMSETAFGELRESSELLGNPEALRRQMAEDGYLYLSGYLDADQILAARIELVRRLDQSGMLDPEYPLIDAVTKPGVATRTDVGAAHGIVPLQQLLYSGRMIELHEKILDGTVRHYDFTWFRGVSGGAVGTTPHCDIVYMGRGTFNLHTTWTPLGDVPIEMGGLMILENSHRQSERLRNYLQRDVDQYCTNYDDAAQIESGEKLWQDWDGRLSSNPVTLREKLGGRWLTTDFHMGDVLVFGMGVVHGSLDNHTNRFRLSTDTRYQLASDPIDERWVGPNPIGHGVAGKKGKIC